MNSIKYRVWDKVDKKFLNPNDCYISPDGRLHIVEREGKIDVGLVWNHDEVDRYEINQYSGHKDCAGRPLFENDLVVDDYDRVYQVAFGGDCWRCEKPKGKFYKNRWISNDLKLIGNVYKR